MAQPQQQDPWEQAAQAYKPQQTSSGAVQPSATQKPGEDWKVWQAQGDDAAPPQTTMQYIGSAAKDFGKGILKGGLNTIANVGRMENKIPFVGSTLYSPENVEKMDAFQAAHGQPQNTAQKIGMGAEQAGEFLIPGGAEEAVAEHMAPILAEVPWLAKAAPALAKMGTSAVASGAVNKAQGGSFGGGAAAGAVGAGVGEGLKKIAPVLAETALNVRGSDRAYGRTPGQAILDETTGFSPRRIATQASGKVDKLSDDLEGMARDSGNPASLQPAREAATQSIGAAHGRNNKATYDKMLKMGRQLDTNLEGEEIPEVTSPQQLLHLKRGIGDLQTSWNPATQPKWVNGQVGHVYHALDSEFDRAVPEGAALNQRISSLIPVAQRANAADLNAGFVQRSLGRFGAHTGALAGAGFGGAYGYKEGGLPGAIAGATLGVLAPEALASPEVQMMGARAINSRAARRAIRGAVGAGLQMGHRSPFSDPSEQP